jgi:hypothetical protein
VLCAAGNTLVTLGCRHWSQAEEELTACRDEITRLRDAANARERQLHLLRAQLQDAAEAAARSEAAATAHAAAAESKLQAAMAEQGRLKEEAAVKGLRFTMFMQEQLQLMKQSEDVKQQRATLRCV